MRLGLPSLSCPLLNWPHWRKLLLRLNPPLSSLSLPAVTDTALFRSEYVTGGGHLVVHGFTGGSIALINTLFNVSVTSLGQCASRTSVTPATRDATATAGTPFAMVRPCAFVATCSSADACARVPAVIINAVHHNNGVLCGERVAATRRRALAVLRCGHLAVDRGCWQWACVVLWCRVAGGCGRHGSLAARVWPPPEPAAHERVSQECGSLPPPPPRPLAPIAATITSHSRARSGCREVLRLARVGDREGQRVRQYSDQCRGAAPDRNTRRAVRCAAPCVSVEPAVCPDTQPVAVPARCGAVSGVASIAAVTVNLLCSGGHAAHRLAVAPGRVHHPDSTRDVHPVPACVCSPRGGSAISRCTPRPGPLPPNRRSVYGANANVAPLAYVPPYSADAVASAGTFERFVLDGVDSNTGYFRAVSDGLRGLSPFRTAFVSGVARHRPLCCRACERSVSLQYVLLLPWLTCYNLSKLPVSRLSLLLQMCPFRRANQW